MNMTTRNRDPWADVFKSFRQFYVKEEQGTKMEKNKEGKVVPRLHFSSAGAKRKKNDNDSDDKKKDVKEDKMAPSANPCGMGWGNQDAENASIGSIKKVKNISKGRNKDADKSKSKVFARVLARVKERMPSPK